MNTDEMSIVRHPDWKDLRHRASQCRPIRTNPASYQPKELDEPLVGEFTD